MTHPPMDPTLGSGGATALGGDTDTHSDSPSLGELFSNVTEDLSTLMRQEVALAKAEATQSAKKAGKAAGMFSGAALGGYLLVLFLSLALMFWLADLMGETEHMLALGALIVAVIWGIVAAVMAAMGKKEMEEVQGMPKTAETVKKIPPALKGHEEENR